MVITMKQTLLYTLSNGDKVTAASVAEKVGFSVGAARSRLKNSLDADVVYASRISLFEASAKVWTLDGGIKGTTKEFSKKSGVSSPSTRLRLKKSRCPRDILKPKSTAILGLTKYCLNSGDHVINYEYAKRHNISNLESHFKLVVQSTIVVYTYGERHLDCNREGELKVTKKPLVFFKSSAKNTNPKIIKPAKVIKKKKKKKNRPKVAVGSYHMGQCQRTGAILLSSR